MTACLPIYCRNNGSGGHRESFVKAYGILILKSNVTALYAIEIWNRMLRLRNLARFFRRERLKKESIVRFLSGIEVTRVKKSDSEGQGGDGLPKEKKI